MTVLSNMDFCGTGLQQAVVELGLMRDGNKSFSRA